MGRVVWCLTPHGRDEVEVAIRELEDMARQSPEVYFFRELAPMDVGHVLDFDSKTPQMPLHGLLKSAADLRRDEVRFLIDQVHEWDLRERTASIETLRSNAWRLPEDSEITPDHPNFIPWLQGSVKLLRHLAKEKDIQVLVERPTLDATYASLESSFAGRESKDLLFASPTFDEDEYLRSLARLHALGRKELALRDRAIALQVKSFLESHPGAHLVVCTGPMHEPAFLEVARDDGLRAEFVFEVRGSIEIVNDRTHRVLESEGAKILRGEAVSMATRRELLAHEVREAINLALQWEGVSSVMVSTSLADEVLGNLGLEDVRRVIEVVRRRRPEQHHVSEIVTWLLQNGKVPPSTARIFIKGKSFPWATSPGAPSLPPPHPGSPFSPFPPAPAVPRAPTFGLPPGMEPRDP